MVEKLSITVTDEHARMLREQVAKGRFASVSELVREALRSLEREEREFEEGLEEIRARVHRSLDDPRPSISSEQVRSRLEKRHSATIAASKRV